ncbi:MAG: SusC/RagA family TonB-linked outer membrane protein, partial [Adhaeribacter sp.]|nr:SusC/RagA family TonB-linked outer membrane protein [Adhaeribacter sp.]
MKVLPPVSMLTATLVCLFSFSEANARVHRNLPAANLKSNSFYYSYLPDAKEEIVVTGTVRDKQTPLPGATIIVKNTTRGTTADVNGNYRITVNRNETLVFSMLGYQNTERVVDNTVIDVTLAINAKQLSEVVVVGYGSTTQGDVTGAITSVKSGDFNA